jgi:predicted TIM-barrel fold metal-dependent hydrolase
MYPKGPVTPGGITDRLLSDYPNVFADSSAGSGLNALLRDEDHARGFLERHQDKLMFGSDCSDSVGSGPGCSGSQCIAALKRLAPSGDVAQKIFWRNAVRILKIPASLTSG